VLEQHSEGATLAVRDRTGSIQVQCSYKPNIALDAGVDAYGYPTMVDGELVLKDALIMPVGTPAKSRVTAEEMSNRPILPVLGAAQAIRRLDRTEAAKGYPVQLEAVVTYCDSRQWSLFVQDASGAVFVAATGKRIDVHAGERVRIKGVTGEGDFAPIISRATVEVLGEAPLPAPARVPLDALLTGQFDCRWVEIHGVVQSATEQEHRPWLQVMTAQGQLPAVLGPGISKSDAEQLLDARVTLRGVAGGQFNDQGQIIAVRLYVPNSGSILVDEAPPSHPFAVPAQKIADLSRYQPDQDIFRRVKICGRVTSVSPDDTISLQDDTGGMLVRVMRYDRMPHIGEEVEILGYPMADEFAITLKDAWSKIDGPGAEPAPLKITAEDVLSNQPNDQLVELEGSLIQDTTLRAGQILVLQAGPNVFDAVLPRTLQAGSDQQLVAGTRLRVAGVCTLEGGRWGQVRSFSLRVRDAGDLAVLSRPPWWNLRRLFMILAGTGVLGALALASNLLLAKKNRQLSVQIRERARAENELHRAHAALKEAHDSLEQRVAERTHELREQIAAKDKAHADLAAAQKDLMEASREAGMAEIATGVLHNVGNVLNSVNVSNTIIQEKLRRSEFLTLGKVRGLLKEHENDLPTFLTSDPKGKLVPGFIIKLADNIDKELSLLQEEHEQLTRNVGHIKEIVATQQTYARVSGSMESLAIATLVDDALQINSVGIGRNGIKVVREYEDVPHVTVDKHKVLQILVNLITNAKHALDESGRKDPQLTLKIARNGNSRLKVSVSDNGIGIAPENFPKVFSYGFTTRRTGHGFGLHSGVNTAREMGGELTAHSDGAGKGATFVLEIPLDDPSKN
jgi:signal transduction histidine kinase